MNITDLLKQKKAPIKQRWTDLILETYPPDGRDFFRQQRDRFTNPVGAALHRQVDGLFDVFAGDSSQDVADILDEFVRIRVVQDFSPSQAIGFILYLKQAVREILAEDINTHELFTELLALETRIDRLLLSAFDVYSRSREEIFKIRAAEIKRSLFMAFKQADLDPKHPLSDDHFQEDESN